MPYTPATPSPATRAALVALLRADPGISATHRARVLAAFDAPAGERPAGWVPASIAAASLGLTLTTLLRWVDAGKVAGRRDGERVTLVNREEVAAYATAHPPRKRRREDDGGEVQ